MDKKNTYVVLAVIVKHIIVEADDTTQAEVLILRSNNNQ